MSLPNALLALLFLALCLGIALWVRRRHTRRFFQSHSMEPDQLHAILFAADRDRVHPVQVIDVRHPLDLLAHSQIIPGSRRISPREILEHPEVLANNRDIIVYCTCPSDKTSTMIMRRAVALGFDKVRFLHGGLEAWKEKHYPIEPYLESFHLDTPA